MSDFNSMVASDALPMLRALGSESVIYAKVNGIRRTIEAIIDRDPPASLDGALRPKMRITVANSATDGIASSELDTGGDKLIVAYRYGGDTAAYRIRRSSDGNAEDPGMMKLELE